MQYKANGRVHDMRTGKTKVPQKGVGGTTVKTPNPVKDQVGPAASAERRAQASRSVAARRAKETAVPGGPKEKKSRFTTKGAMGRLAKGMSGMKEDMAAQEAGSANEMAQFKQTAAEMSSQRQAMQQSAPGRAQEIINKRRI